MRIQVRITGCTPPRAMRAARQRHVDRFGGKLGLCIAISASASRRAFERGLDLRPWRGLMAGPRVALFLNGDRPAQATSSAP